MATIFTPANRLPDPYVLSTRTRTETRFKPCVRVLHSYYREARIKNASTLVCVCVCVCRVRGAG
jgi:hypothetical protein